MLKHLARSKMHPWKYAKKIKAFIGLSFNSTYFNICFTRHEVSLSKTFLSAFSRTYQSDSSYSPDKGLDCM